VLSQLKRRNAVEVQPFISVFQLQEKIQERSLALVTENQSLLEETTRLKQEHGQLVARAREREEQVGQTSTVEVQEMQKKLFTLQEELTEMHRRKGENAQQVIDLSQALRLSEKQLEEVKAGLAVAEATMIGLKEDLITSEAVRAETEATSQLLKDEYQALQLALTSAEEKLRGVQRENETLVQQLMVLKTMDVERMNFENEMFVAKQQQQMQLELAEAVKEGKSVSPEMVARLAQEQGGEQGICVGVIVPTRVHMKFDAHDGEVMSARWDYSGRYFATSGADRKIKIWEMSQRATPELRATLVGSNAAIMGIDFDSAGTMILGSSNDFATRVWTVEDSRLRHTLTGHSGKVLSAKFLGDATRVVSGSHDRTLKVWDLRSKACICTKFAGSSCNDLVTSEQVIISGHFDKKVRLWDNRSSSSEPMNELVVGGKVTSLDLSKDMNLLAVCSRDDTIQVVDLRKGAGTVCQVGGEGFHVGCDWSRLAFSPDSSYVTCGAGDGAVHVWSVLTGATETVLRSHSSLVAATAWHPGGSSILSVDKTKTAIVWC